MKDIKVKSSKGDYRICVGSDLLSKTGDFLKELKLDRQVLIISQKKIAEYFLPVIAKSLRKKGIASDVFLIPDGEKAKDFSELIRIHRYLAQNGYERSDCLVALGGGVVGDLTGFAAATYLRGVPYINIGTTLLAQVDSSIGGKTGINLPEGKNLVGSFNPAKLVLSDVETLRTLPERELKASLAEVAKYGVIRDPVIFRLLEREPAKVLKGNPSILSDLVVRSAHIKALTVSRDEFETKGERITLNYGHTFGHAFEKITGYKKLLHGEAVSLGMVSAARLSQLLGLCTEDFVIRQETLLRRLDLPIRMKMKYQASEILECMMRDKKKKAGKLRFVLPVKIGQVVVREDVPESLIRKILPEICR